jgi:hypothetical protein
MGVKVRLELANLRARANRNGGLMVDDKQHTSVPNLYAAGDVTSGTSLPFRSGEPPRGHRYLQQPRSELLLTPPPIPRQRNFSGPFLLD